MLFWKKSEKAKWLKPPAAKNQEPPQEGFWKRQPGRLTYCGTFSTILILVTCLKIIQRLEVRQHLFLSVFQIR